MNAYGIFKGGRKLREITLKFSPYMARFVGGMFRHPEQRDESTKITRRILSFGRHVEVLVPDELLRRVAAEVGEVGEVVIKDHAYQGNLPRKEDVVITRNHERYKIPQTVNEYPNKHGRISVIDLFARPGFTSSRVAVGNGNDNACS